MYSALYTPHINSSIPVWNNSQEMDDLRELELTLFICQHIAFIWEPFWAISGFIVSVFCIVSLRRNFQFSSSTQSLLLMASADLMFLSSALIFNVWQYVATKFRTSFPDDASAALCKILIFAAHLTSAVSVWAWMILSLQRYLAAFHPIRYHVSRWGRDPKIPLLAICICCICLESWLLLAVTYNNSFCGVDVQLFSPKLFATFSSFELFWSYFVPFVLTVVLEVQVLVFKPSSILDESQRQSRDPDADHSGCSPRVEDLPLMKVEACSKRWARKRRESSMRQLKRLCFLIALDFSLNFPSYLCRLINCIFPDDPLSAGSTKTSVIVELVADMLYYPQYAINVVYLWLLVFRPSKEQSRSSANTTFRQAAADQNLQHLVTLRSAVPRRSISVSVMCKAAEV